MKSYISKSEVERVNSTIINQEELVSFITKKINHNIHILRLGLGKENILIMMTIFKSTFKWMKIDILSFPFTLFLMGCM